MFTGIIESVGEVVSLAQTAEGGRLSLKVPFAGELVVGESVAVNGCCLTVTEVVEGVAAFDLLGETLRVTNLGKLGAGGNVNLERAVRVGDRMSGHFVQGHVDCVSEIRAMEGRGDDHRVEVTLPTDFARYVVHKGSIAIDGISLTIAELGEDSFSVWIIPHTFEVTNLGGKAVGDAVNLEFDVIGKYAQRAREVGGTK
jgi:riboflavin synthase